MPWQSNNSGWLHVFVGRGVNESYIPQNLVYLGAGRHRKQPRFITPRAEEVNVLTIASRLQQVGISHDFLDQSRRLVKIQELAFFPVIVPKLFSRGHISHRRK